MTDLFTLNPEIRGVNKKVFWEVVNELPDGAIIRITPFTQELRRRGATISEESTSRYMRYARLQWGWGVDFVAQGKGVYIIKRSNENGKI
ncbi:MAG TPA: hypothetical protein PLQ41_07365 [bacterium]|nr:hypothetical protein [bacterium]